MCAICGIIHFAGQPVDEAALVTMRDMMVNRGPEHGGLFLRGNVGLGHRRLRIIDLSPLGNQPMTNEDKTVCVVFNGEIYNFLDLRALLEKKGHKFQSRSDTEVLVHGYEEWGEELFVKLNGMFAVGIWDSRKDKLVLARDRFGKKPLFFMEKGGTVQFASEIKALWKNNRADFTLNHEAIDCYLHHLSPTQEHCIFNEVTKVRPAHYRVFTRDGSTEKRYWKPSFVEKEDYREAAALDAIDFQLRSAIQRRMISDVPLGAFLSGGIDSSLVVALMSQLSTKRVKTFSIGFEESDFSELQYSRAVARRYNTEHREIILKPDVWQILPSLVWEYGEPFADSSAIPTYYVSKAAKEFVTVALTGDGGDEMFGGYDIAKVSYYGHYFRKVCPKPTRQWLEKKFSNGHAEQKIFRKVKTLLVHGSGDPSIRHSYTQGWTPSAKAKLYTPEFRASLGGHAAYHIFEQYDSAIRGLNLIDQNLLLTQVGRLPNDYLIKVDVASMKSALELRSPFLDAEVARLAELINPLLKVSGGTQKYLLKKLSERYLPRDVIYRPKRGFSLPLTHWLRKDFADPVRKLLLDGEIIKQGWFRRDAVEKFLAQHRDQVKDHTHRIWSLLWLELWHRLFITGTLRPEESLEG